MKLTLRSILKSQYRRTNIARDRKFKAKKPGWRKSASGNWYYESRANRSDVVPKWRI